MSLHSGCNIFVLDTKFIISASKLMQSGCKVASEKVKTTDDFIKSFSEILLKEQPDKTCANETLISY